ALGFRKGALALHHRSAGAFPQRLDVGGSDFHGWHWHSGWLGRGACGASALFGGRGFESVGSFASVAWLLARPLAQIGLGPDGLVGHDLLRRSLVVRLVGTHVAG